jgi:hypothetical protein
MSKRKEIKKDLQNSIFAIVEMYKKQKGRRKRKELGDFIGKKMAEIISFRNDLGDEKHAGRNSEITIPGVPELKPSAALLDQLINQGWHKDAKTIR